jgi:hypothetical protein
MQQIDIGVEKEGGGLGWVRLLLSRSVKDRDDGVGVGAETVRTTKTLNSAGGEAAGSRLHQRVQ